MHGAMMVDAASANVNQLVKLDNDDDKIIDSDAETFDPDAETKDAEEVDINKSVVVSPMRKLNKMPQWQGTRSLRALSRWLEEDIVSDESAVDDDDKVSTASTATDPLAWMEHVVDDPEKDFAIARAKLCTGLARDE